MRIKWFVKNQYKQQLKSDKLHILQNWINCLSY